MDGIPLEGLRALVETARDESGWLILCGHDIRRTAGRQVVEVGVLEAFCQHAGAPESGIWLETVGTVAAYVAAQR